MPGHDTSLSAASYHAVSVGTSREERQRTKAARETCGAGGSRSDDVSQVRESSGGSRSRPAIADVGAGAAPTAAVVPRGLPTGCGCGSLAARSYSHVRCCHRW